MALNTKLGGHRLNCIGDKFFGDQNDYGEVNFKYRGRFLANTLKNNHMLRRLINLIAHRTRLDPIHASEIEDAMNLETGHTNEPTRFFIKDAIIHHQLPIGSNSQGYFLINTEEDFGIAIISLTSRINALQSRIDGLQTGWHRRQLSLQNGNNWPMTEN